MARDDLSGAKPISPPWWRLCLALFVAPILPAALFAQWALRGGQSEETLFGRFMVVSVFGVYPAVIFCGIPARIFLRNKVRPTLPATSLAGGLGLDEPNVYGPHFAVAALDANGRPALWAWSYKKADFWPLSDKAQSRGGVLTDFVSEETLLAACPNLRTLTNAKRLKE